MKEGLNWAAPIEPGYAMLGLTLGMSLDSVKAQMESEGGLLGNIVSFQNSPRLIFDDGKEDVILLRAADMAKVTYEWQDVLVRLIFDNGVLASIVALGGRGNESYFYQGKIHSRVGLGSQVVDLLEFGSLEYDDAEEVFICSSLDGLEVGGSSACDLLVDPSQIVTFVRIF
jgi:hypothetical protein